LEIKVGILGATGYTGSELIRLLHQHPYSKITYCSSRQYNGKKISDVLEYLKGYTDIVLEEFDPTETAEKCDVVFSCLPHGTSQSMIKELPDSVRVIDLSADFRLKDASVFKDWYEEHHAIELLETAVYGLCEIYRDKIKKARLVANPGCYPTSALLPLIPLLNQRIIDKDGITIDSKSGVSGAGRGLSLKTHICESGENFSAYKVGRDHRHIPEIEQELSAAAGSTVTVEFTPHLIPVSRGMLSTIYMNASSGSKEIKKALRKFYKDSAFVHVLDSGFPTIKDVRATNRCIIGAADTKPGRVVIVSVIDNLVKGASGQALQNMNIMFGIDETLGLDSIPVYP
jgi:N-acetyl-gamma-glutamyl-phosphate reductase